MNLFLLSNPNASYKVTRHQPKFLTLPVVKRTYQTLPAQLGDEAAVWCMYDQVPVNMMTSSNGNIFRVTGPLCGEFTGPGEFPTQRPLPRSFDVFFDLCLNKRLSKRPWGWSFETPSWSLWRQCNDLWVSRKFIIDVSESIFPNICYHSMKQHCG